MNYLNRSHPGHGFLADSTSDYFSVFAALRPEHSEPNDEEQP